MRLAASIDDIAVRQQDTNLSGTFNDTWYHLTDTLFSTIAIIDDAANLIERVSYDAYGNARHHRMADLNGDGATTSADFDLIRGLDGSWGEYGIGDLNRDGIVNSADSTLLNNDTVVGYSLPAGQISLTDNNIGYAGYVFNAEIHGSGLYTVRWRNYSPELGRWRLRDPMGYIDGMNLYQYVRSNPLRYLDPMGLFAVETVVIAGGAKAFGGGAAVAGGGGVGGTLLAGGGSVAAAPVLVTVGVAGAGAALGYTIGSGLAETAAGQAATDWVGEGVGTAWHHLTKTRVDATPITPSGPRDPGRCTKRQHRHLQNLVNRDCKNSGPTSCKGLRKGDNDKIMEVVNQNLKCQSRRRTINRTCYGGGDQAHRDVVRDLEKRLEKCLKKICGTWPSRS